MIKIEKEGKYMGKKIFVSYKYADDFVENLAAGVNTSRLSPFGLMNTVP